MGDPATNITGGLLTASERAEQGRDLWAVVSEGRRGTLADFWREETGGNPDDDLSFLQVLGEQDAIRGVATAAAAGLAAAQCASSFLTAAAAASSTVPIIGWCVAAAALVANFVAAVFGNARAFDAADRYGRRTMQDVREIHRRALGRDLPYKQHSQFGFYPDFASGRWTYADAWWWLRIAEALMVLAGRFQEEGRWGHYRHALPIDVATDHPIAREVSEGNPYVPLFASGLEFVNGSKARTRLYGRGVHRINAEGAFTTFEGGGAKARRVATACRSASRMLRLGIEKAASPNEARAMLAALMLSCEAIYQPSGASWRRGEPEDLAALAATLPRERKAKTRVAMTLRDRSIIGTNKPTMIVVSSAAPYETQSTAQAGEPGTVVAWDTDGTTPCAVFLAQLPALGPIPPIVELVLCYFGPIPPFATNWDLGPMVARSTPRDLVPGYAIKTVLPPEHKGNNWCRVTAASWRSTVRVRPGFAGAPLIRGPESIDLDAGSGVAGEGGGGGLLLLAGLAAAYVASR